MPPIPSPYPKTSAVEFTLHVVYALSAICAALSLWVFGKSFDGSIHGGVLEVMINLLMPVITVGAFIVFALPVVAIIGFAALSLAIYRLIKKLPVRSPVAHWAFVGFEVLTLALGIIVYSQF
jgi:hypothetical protein